MSKTQKNTVFLPDQINSLTQKIENNRELFDSLKYMYELLNFKNESGTSHPDSFRLKHILGYGRKYEQDFNQLNKDYEVYKLQRQRLLNEFNSGQTEIDFSDFTNIMSDYGADSAIWTNLNKLKNNY